MNPRTDRGSPLVSTLLVSAGALGAEQAKDPAPVLLDVRWRLGGPPGIDSYREGHLPGAVFTDLNRDLAGPPGAAGRHPLPDPAAFQAAMRAAGVSQHRPAPGPTGSPTPPGPWRPAPREERFWDRTGRANRVRKMLVPAPFIQGRNEQALVHAATAFAKHSRR
jgi:hypothetical protein